MANSRLVSIIGLGFLAVGSTVCAHTTVRDQATEGVTSDNALKIGHGCTSETGATMPVVAQSVVIPTVTPEIVASRGFPPASLGEVIAPGSLAGLITPIQDRNIFQAQQVKLDSAGNRIGFSSSGGSLTTGFAGRVPFQFAAPKFVATSCAVRLLIKVAIVDVCVRDIPGGSLEKGRVNFWIPDNGSIYAVAAHGAHNDEGVGAPATLTVNRNLTTNPMPAQCGAGFDITVTPTAQDIDANLPIPGYWE